MSSFPLVHTPVSTADHSPNDVDNSDPEPPEDEYDDEDENDEDGKEHARGDENGSEGSEKLPQFEALHTQAATIESDPTFSNEQRSVGVDETEVGVRSLYHNNESPPPPPTHKQHHQLHQPLDNLIMMLNRSSPTKRSASHANKEQRNGRHPNTVTSVTCKYQLQKPSLSPSVTFTVKQTTTSASRNGHKFITSRPYLSSVPPSSETSDTVEIPQYVFDTRRVFVGRLVKGLAIDVLQKHFSAFGKLERISLPEDATTGKSKGYAFVTFVDQTSVAKVLRQPQVIAGIEVDCKPALMKDISRTSTHSISGTFFRTNKIFIGGLPTSINAGRLREYFSQYGSLVACKVIVDKASGLSKGYGFCEYEDPQSVDRVIQNYDHHILDGKWVQVKRALPSAPMVPTAQATAVTSSHSSLYKPYNAASSTMGTVETLLFTEQSRNGTSHSSKCLVWSKGEQRLYETGASQSLLGPGDLYYSRSSMTGSTGSMDRCSAESNSRPPPPPLYSTGPLSSVLSTMKRCSPHERSGPPSSTSQQAGHDIGVVQRTSQPYSVRRRPLSEDGYRHCSACFREREQALDTHIRKEAGADSLSVTLDSVLSKRRRLLSTSHSFDAHVAYDKQRLSQRHIHHSPREVENAQGFERSSSTDDLHYQEVESHNFDKGETSEFSPCDRKDGCPRSEESNLLRPSLMHSQWYRLSSSAPGIKTVSSLAASALRCKRNKGDCGSHTVIRRASDATASESKDSSTHK